MPRCSCDRYLRALSNEGLGGSPARFFAFKESNVRGLCIKQFLLEEQGVTMVEYALLGSLIAVVCTLSVMAVGGATNDLFIGVCNAVTTAVSGAPGC